MPDFPVGRAKPAGPGCWPREGEALTSWPTTGSREGRGGGGRPASPPDPPHAAPAVVASTIQVPRLYPGMGGGGEERVRPPRPRRPRWVDCAGEPRTLRVPSTPAQVRDAKVVTRTSPQPAGRSQDPAAAPSGRIKTPKAFRPLDTNAPPLRGGGHQVLTRPPSKSLPNNNSGLRLRETGIWGAP